MFPAIAGLMKLVGPAAANAAKAGGGAAGGAGGGGGLLQKIPDPTKAIGAGLSAAGEQTQPILPPDSSAASTAAANPAIVAGLSADTVRDRKNRMLLDKLAGMGQDPTEQDAANRAMMGR